MDNVIAVIKISILINQIRNVLLSKKPLLLKIAYTIQVYVLALNVEETFS